MRAREYWLMQDIIAKMVRDLENLFVIRRSRFFTGYEPIRPKVANDNKKEI